MWLLLSRIPKGATCKELEKFIGKGLQPSWMLLPLLSHSILKRCEILQIFNPETKTAEYHGLVQIDPGKAEALINRLNGRKLQGTPIEVRKYIRRSSIRDHRRVLSDHEGPQEFRRQDRRRDGLRSRVLHAPEVARVLCIL